MEEAIKSAEGALASMINEKIKTAKKTKGVMYVQVEPTDIRAHLIAQYIMGFIAGKVEEIKKQTKQAIKEADHARKRTTRRSRQATP